MGGTRCTGEDAQDLFRTLQSRESSSSDVESGEEECCGEFILGAIAADIAVPDPSDAAWPKWVVYGIGAAVATAAGYDVYNEMFPTTVMDPYILEHRRVTDSEVDGIAREWGYENAHDLKDAHDVGSEMDIYIDDKTGELILRRNPKAGPNDVPDQPVYPNN